MPTSTQKGFLTGKWELKYLRRRFRAHRNKVEEAKPAIDSKSPTPRPHVIYKVKKAVCEDRRQIKILAENFRILKKTSEIMGEAGNNQTNSTKQPSLDNKRNEKRCVHFELSQGESPQLRREQRPLTAITKRNYHIIQRWFQLKFGKYVPWWAQINY